MHDDNPRRTGYAPRAAAVLFNGLRARRLPARAASDARKPSRLADEYQAEFRSRSDGDIDDVFLSTVFAANKRALVTRLLDVVKHRNMGRLT